jgi:hypothetical protein
MQVENFSMKIFLERKKKHSHPFKLDDQTGGINLI